MIRRMEWTLGKMLRLVGEHLREDALHVSDERRTVEHAIEAVATMVTDPTCEVFEIGDNQGVLIFSDIVDGSSCWVAVFVWDRSVWSKSLAREGVRLVCRVADEHGLTRMEGATADPRMEKVAELMGFRTEGIKKDAFKRGDCLYDLALIGKAFAPMEDSNG